MLIIVQIISYELFVIIIQGKNRPRIAGGGGEAYIKS